MKVLEIYFESEAKIMYWNIFVRYYLAKLTQDCNSENTASFPAHIVITFKMGKRNQTKPPKPNPKLEYVHMVTVECQLYAKPWL